MSLSVKNETATFTAEEEKKLVPLRGCSAEGVVEKGTKSSPPYKVLYNNEIEVGRRGWERKGEKVSRRGHYYLGSGNVSFDTPRK